MAEIQEALIESFPLEILDELDEEDLVQFCSENVGFAKMMLQAVTIAVRRAMLDTGVDLEELD